MVSFDIEDILNGNKKGTSHQTFCGEGLLCEFEDYSILYDGSKLVEQNLKRKRAINEKEI